MRVFMINLIHLYPIHGHLLTDARRGANQMHRRHRQSSVTKRTDFRLPAPTYPDAPILKGTIQRGPRKGVQNIFLTGGAGFM